MSLRTSSPAHRVVAALVAGAIWCVTGCAGDAPADAPSASPPAGAGGRGTIVSRVDVDGDRTDDTIEYAVLSGDRVRITVTTADGQSAQRILDTALWPGSGGVWLGAARLDGESGAELVVGTAMGAHTPLYTVLTMRGDELRVQPNPAASSPQWWTDAFAGGYAGWVRTVDGAVRLSFTVIFRHGTSPRFAGTRDTFRWDRPDGRWVAEGSRDIRVRGERAAARVSGWHVAGLPVSFDS